MKCQPLSRHACAARSQRLGTCLPAIPDHGVDGDGSTRPSMTMTSSREIDLRMRRAPRGNTHRHHRHHSQPRALGPRRHALVAPCPSRSEAMHVRPNHTYRRSKSNQNHNHQMKSITHLNGFRHGRQDCICHNQTRTFAGLAGIRGKGEAGDTLSLLSFDAIVPLQE